MKRRLPLLAILAILPLLAYVFLAPRPMLQGSEPCKVQYILYNPDYSCKETINLTDFDSDAIIACLRKYKAENSLTLVSAGSYSDIILELFVTQGDDSKTIGLGKRNYICSAQENNHRSFLYRIKQGEALRDEVLQILNLPPVA